MYREFIFEIFILYHCILSRIFPVTSTHAHHQSPTLLHKQTLRSLVFSNSRSVLVCDCMSFFLPLSVSISVFALCHRHGIAFRYINSIETGTEFECGKKNDTNTPLLLLLLLLHTYTGYWMHTQRDKSEIRWWLDGDHLFLPSPGHTHTICYGNTHNTVPSAER